VIGKRQERGGKAVWRCEVHRDAKIINLTDGPARTKWGLSIVDWHPGLASILQYDALGASRTYIGGETPECVTFIYQGT